MDRILVANRGEIAVRIISACQKLGIETVAVYSDADRNAPFVKRADMAFHIGLSEARASYLDGGKIIEIAKKANADAIHPGYGFLAENDQFAALCEKEGITFIGPSSDIIAQMGSKIAAKNAAIEASVPVVPGYNQDDQSETALIQAANDVGTPLLIKASAGGGGRGMRRVYDLKTFKSELSLAQKEAESAFGNSDVLLERLIEKSRHVEVQILADKHGNVLHAYERDCSIQRNHQKVIEEAPAPNLPANIRNSMLKDSVKLAKKIGYNSVGTVEFIYDPMKGEYFFLEMNTRLQVEHPVTEFITGLDLVEWQIRIAMDEILPFMQTEITCNGWAIEARIAAEDAADNYRPQTGKITHYQEPTGASIRIDSGIEAGSMVSHYYDSMLSKVIASGKDRKSAIRRLKRALGKYQIAGLDVNINFVRDILDLKVFQEAVHHTATLDDTWEKGWSRQAISDLQIAEAALCKLMQQQIDLETKPRSPWHSLGAWRITEPLGRAGKATYYLPSNNGEFITIELAGRKGMFDISVSGKHCLSVTDAMFHSNQLTYETEGQRFLCNAAIDHDAIHLQTEKGQITIALLNAEAALLDSDKIAQGDGRSIKAMMPGLVVDIYVKEGDLVSEGQRLLSVEAMKLLQDMTATQAGRITSINYNAGVNVEGGATLISIEPIEKAGE